jgi:hypothetical protein
MSTNASTTASTMTTASTTTYVATLATPEPRNGLDGLMHFMRITFAKLGVVVTDFHTPNYQQLESFRLVHLKFNFLLETDDMDTHRREFRLSSDALEFRTRHSYAQRILERLHEFSAAETEYLALDKETRGPMTVKPLEIVHTPASERGTEKFWKVKLVQARKVTAVAPMFR